MKSVSSMALAFLCLTLLAQPGFAGPFTWTEVGEAGALPATANVTAGPPARALHRILGNLTDVFDVDMFQILILDFLNFSATTLGGGFDVDDPQLFLFDSGGRAVYSNDDAESGLLGSQSQLTAGHPLGPPAVGYYYLAIGWFDNEPLSATGPMFQNGIGINGPDFGGGGADPIAGWNSDVIGRIDLPTSYGIKLTGAAPALHFDFPEPSTWLTLAAGLVGLLIARGRLDLL